MRSFVKAYIVCIRVQATMRSNGSKVTMLSAKFWEFVIDLSFQNLHMESDNICSTKNVFEIPNEILGFLPNLTGFWSKVNDNTILRLMKFYCLCPRRSPDFLTSVLLINTVNSVLYYNIMK